MPHSTAHAGWILGSAQSIPIASFITQAVQPQGPTGRYKPLILARFAPADKPGPFPADLRRRGEWETGRLGVADGKTSEEGRLHLKRTPSTRRQLKPPPLPT